VERAFHGCVSLTFHDLHIVRAATHEGHPRLSDGTAPDVGGRQWVTEWDSLPTAEHLRKLAEQSKVRPEVFMG
jgi:hypothetical protein